MLALLDGQGFDLRTSVWATMSVVTYVLGAALREVQEIRWHQAEAEREAAMTEAELAEEQASFFRRVGGSGRYPHLGG